MVTYDPAARRDTPLALQLRARIRSDGPIRVDDYICACLYHPSHGYYVHRDAIGAGGDFITAPEISQVFGEMIGLWTVVVWGQMGQPSPFKLVEFGPGRGTLMRDALRAMRVRPAILDAVRVQLLDTSVALASQQRLALAEFSVPITWPNNLVHADEPTVPAILIANEFLDTMPIEQFVRLPEGWGSRRVGLDSDGALTFVTVPDCPAPMMADLKLRFPRARPGDVCEVCRLDHDVITALARPQCQVAALFIDYGHTQSSPGDTLQAVRHHRHEHPLTSPGEADITAQVDFQRAAERLLTPALASDGPVTQAEFLGSLGAVERSRRLIDANPGSANAIETGLARLMSTSGMGARFHALGLRTATLPPLPGFETASPIRR